MFDFPAEAGRRGGPQRFALFASEKCEADATGSESWIRTEETTGIELGVIPVSPAFKRRYEATESTGITNDDDFTITRLP